jgi:hypothetical protein
MSIYGKEITEIATSANLMGLTGRQCGNSLRVVLSHRKQEAEKIEMIQLFSNNFEDELQLAS